MSTPAIIISVIIVGILWLRDMSNGHAIDNLSLRIDELENENE